MAQVNRAVTQWRQRTPGLMYRVKTPVIRIPLEKGQWLSGGGPTILPFNSEVKMASGVGHFFG